MGNFSRLRLLVELVLVHPQKLGELRRIYKPSLRHQLVDHRHRQVPPVRYYRRADWAQIIGKRETFVVPRNLQGAKPPTEVANIWLTFDPFLAYSGAGHRMQAFMTKVTISRMVIGRTRTSALIAAGC
jgi:hypothetical protein